MRSVRTTAAFAALTLGALAWSTGAASAAAPAGIERIAGGDRYETAVKVSQALVPTPAQDQVVYVASGENFPDALAAAPATRRWNSPAPLLLVPRDAALPGVVTAELDRLDPGSIQIVGGTSAVSAAVEGQLRAWDPEPERLSGPNRYGTAAAVAGAAGTDPGGTVFLATGQNYPDALAASAVAASSRSALLLTDPKNLPAETATALKNQLKPARVVVLGSTGVVSDAVVSQVTSVVPGVEVQRIGGADRYETAALVSGFAHSSPTTGAFLATGINFPDALAAGPLAAERGQPLLLSQSECAPPTTAAEFTRLQGGTVTVLGGAGVVSDAAANMSGCAPPPPPAAPPGKTYGGGTLLVGKDIPAGTYVSTGNSNCYWVRASDASGQLDSIIANDIISGQAVVTILATDNVFKSSRCSTWTPANLTPKLQTSIGQGDFLVNVHVAPGTYQASPTESCYWHRSSAASGELDDIIANENVAAGERATVTIDASDLLFSSSRCGTWTRVD